MRKLIYLTLSPASRLVRLMVGEKRLSCDPVTAEDPGAHLPVFIDLDGTRPTGYGPSSIIWRAPITTIRWRRRIRMQRAESCACSTGRWGRCTTVTRRIVYEKAAQRFTGAPSRSAPDMNVIRQGREALRVMLKTIGTRPRPTAISPSANARWPIWPSLRIFPRSTISAKFRGRISAAAEWYMRMKSRPVVPFPFGRPRSRSTAAMTYAELDF